MRRLQLYLTDDQRRGIAARADDEGRSQAEVVRRILDAALGLREHDDERIAAVDATSGILSDSPDWPEWLRGVRGRGAGARLSEVGL